MGELFGTDGIRGKANHYPITTKVAEDLGKAVVTLVATGDETPKVVIARDTRASGAELQKAFVRGIIDAGGEALLLGVLPTNAVSFAVQRENADVGMVISASHNPADENGFKFFNSHGVKFSEEEENALEQLMEARDFRVVGAGPKERDIEGYRAYKESLIQSLDGKALKGLRVAVDAGNGSASYIVHEIFEKLGAEVYVINNKPDGNNINHNCGALFPQQLQRLVREKGFDCGVALDGDADRLAMVDENGNVVDGDGLILAMAKEMLRQGKLAKNTVVVTEYTNTAVDDELEKIGVRTVKVKVGDKYVYEEMAKSGYSLGGEQSGHIIFSGNATADAILAALQILS
ncbi:MAG: phosphoglucosamine mutase, partial [Nanoarchaeota archaeon]